MSEKPNLQQALKILKNIEPEFSDIVIESQIELFKSKKILKLSILEEAKYYLTEIDKMTCGTDVTINENLRISFGQFLAKVIAEIEALQNELDESRENEAEIY